MMMLQLFYRIFFIQKLHLIVPLCKAAYCPSLKWSRTYKFCDMAIDQYQEQNNAIIKGSGGVLGLADNPPALRRWMVAGPEVARMIAELEDDNTRSHQKDSEHHHHEQHPGVQATFIKDVRSLSAVVEEMGSPFLEESEDLLVLDTRDQT